MERNAARYELGEMEAACPRPTRAPIVAPVEPGVDNIFRVSDLERVRKAYTAYMFVGGVK